MGIDIGSGGIKIVELRLEKKRPVLFTYGLTQNKQDVHKLHVAEDKNIAGLLSGKGETQFSAGQTNPATIITAGADTDRMNDAQIEKYAEIIKNV